eukprot:IDg15519t1
MADRLSIFGRGALAVGSAVLALANPARADMVAVLGEVTGGMALPRLRRRLEQSPTGAEMLSSLQPARFPAEGSASLPALRALPDGSLGRSYATFMDSRHFEPESRLPVRFVNDARDAWVLQRYRDVHDLWHVLTGMPTNLLGEIAQKWFEAVHTGLPVAVLSAAFAPARLDARKRALLASELAPWAVDSAGGAVDLLAIRYEDHLARNLDELRQEWNVKMPHVSDPALLYGKRWKEKMSRS